MEDEKLRRFMAEAVRVRREADRNVNIHVAACLGLQAAMYVSSLIVPGRLYNRVLWCLLSALGALVLWMFLSLDSGRRWPWSRPNRYPGWGEGEFRE